MTGLILVSPVVSAPVVPFVAALPTIKGVTPPPPWVMVMALLFASPWVEMVSALPGRAPVPLKNWVAVTTTVPPLPMAPMATERASMVLKSTLFPERMTSPALPAEPVGVGLPNWSVDLAKLHKLPLRLILLVACITMSLPLPTTPLLPLLIELKASARMELPVLMILPLLAVTSIRPALPVFPNSPLASE